MGVSIVPFYHHYHHHHCHNNNHKGCKRPLWSPMRWRCRLLRWTERTQPGAIGPRGSRSDCSPSAGRRTPANIQDSRSYWNLYCLTFMDISLSMYLYTCTYIMNWFLKLLVADLFDEGDIHLQLHVCVVGENPHSNRLQQRFQRGLTTTSGW